MRLFKSGALLTQNLIHVFATDNSKLNLWLLEVFFFLLLFVAFTIKKATKFLSV